VSTDPDTIQKFTSGVVGLLATMAAMQSMASPIAPEDAVSSANSVVAERDILDPRVETISIEEATNRGFLHKYWEFQNATANAVPGSSSALEKRQWTGAWDCSYNSGGVYAPSHVYTCTNPARRQGLALAH
jgi:hypothetical protein